MKYELGNPQPDITLPQTWHGMSLLICGHSETAHISDPRSYHRNNLNAAP